MQPYIGLAPKPNHDKHALSIYQAMNAHLKLNTTPNVTQSLGQHEFDDFTSKVMNDTTLDFSTKCNLIENLYNQLTALGLTIK